MPQTITQKILARASGRDSVTPGETIEAKIDKLMMHDITSSGAIKLLRDQFKNKIAEGLKIIVVPDHYVPNKDIKSAILYQELKQFVEEHQEADITAYMVEGGDYGVCHVMLPEKGHVLPGDVIVGGDSHTCTYGALGAFSTGIGTTEVGNVLATGRLWFRVPETYKFEVNGEMPYNVMAKDLFLRVVGDIGVDGALYQAMEWCGKTIKDMPIDEISTVTNMAIEAGAKSGIVAPDEKVLQYLRRRKSGLSKWSYWTQKIQELQSDPDAEYSAVKRICASGLEPLVACPDLPSNVKPASELHNVKIDQGYVGGCTGGKYHDFVEAAKVLKGRRIAKGVRLLFVPSTADIQRKLVRDGIYDIAMDAGAVVTAATCGACLGGYMGILAPGEVAISSTNRNFRGRMGHPDSKVYLASPKTVAASALAGYITGAEK